MTSYRADQVGEQVREEIMSIIRRELKDPRIGFVSITSVRMSPDLRSARVRVSVLGNPEQQRESLAGLVSAKPSKSSSRKRPPTRCATAGLPPRTRTVGSCQFPPEPATSVG